MKGAKLTKILIAAGLLLCVCSIDPAFSQEHRQRARVRENILTLRLVRMTQALELTQEQTAEIYPELFRLEKEKAELQARLAKHIAEMRLMVAKDVPAGHDIAGIVETVTHLRRDIRRKDEEFEAFLDERLDPVQKARYFLFTIDFFRGLGEKIDRARMPAPREKRKTMF
jgi:predicted RNase H-like nuclease (RuvC/YqgF family)